MYKLLIVEDEDLIRNAILSGIDWKSLNLEVQGAEDGEVALEITHTFRPDIVLTDIRMPFIDGLELARRLREDYPRTIVIILSGHDEFSYAQEAVQLGVRQYLQKPIVPNDLIAILQKTTRELDARANRENREAKLRLQVKQSLPFLREKLLNRILHNTITPSEIKRMLDFTGTHLKGAGFTVCLIECEPDTPLYGEEAAVLDFSITQILEHEIGSDGVAFESVSGRRVLIYSARTMQTERPYINTLLSEISDIIFQEHGIVTTSAIGTRVATVPEIHVSYESAKLALEQRVFDGRGQIYDAYQTPCVQNYFPFDRSKSLIDKLKLLSDQEFSEALDSFFGDLRQMRSLSGENLLTVMLDLANCGYRILMETGCAEEFSPNAIYNDLFALTTLDQYQSVLAGFFADLRAVLRRQQQSHGNQLIGKICRFIDENYCDSSISLNSVASSVFISPTYLSILFKKEMGTTFIEYISRLRMERAKQLLRDENLKTYEAAEQIGYNDPQYFSSCFKKYTGMTPSEYKAQFVYTKESQA